MWRDHPFGQRNKTTERAMGVGVCGDRRGEVGQNLKKKGGQAIQGGLHNKIGRVRTLLPTMVFEDRYMTILFSSALCQYSNMQYTIHNFSLLGLDILSLGAGAFQTQQFSITFPCLNTPNLAKIYLFEVNNRNSGKRCEICSNLTIKAPGRRQ